MSEKHKRSLSSFCRFISRSNSKENLSKISKNNVSVTKTKSNTTPSTPRGNINATSLLYVFSKAL